MTRQEIGIGTGESFDDLLAMVPVDDLDSVEIEGGLTWRQAMILAHTAGLLVSPSDESGTPGYDDRRMVWESIDGSLRDRVADTSTPLTASEAIILSLEAADREYANICETSPELTPRKTMIEQLLAVWRDEDLPYITETLASNVLWYMYPPTN